MISHNPGSQPEVAAVRSGSFPVVALGASAGGLEACSKLLGALPADIGMAFILVQHLDPTHESMMVELLTPHTSLTVQEAVDGMLVAPNHLYVIPPGAYLAATDGLLHLSQPQARHGARLPFDFLLRSLATTYGPRAICVVLSGTGTDGSIGLKALSDAGGFVIAQDPAEAGYDGMPKSAIATGLVDLVLTLDKIPEALIHRGNGHQASPELQELAVEPRASDTMPAILDLLKEKTAHDFTLYKPGTLRRRIERRMAMAATKPDDMPQYLSILRSDPQELDSLSKDLLINVTSFFRDPSAFNFLEKSIIPALVKDRATEQSIRIWIAGCSTGEETYSLAILFQEAIAASGLNVKFQAFASDVDADAVASAREGLYPTTIEADVSRARLDRFFTKSPQGYRVSGELRSTVIFTVQDVLADPPFSNLDLVSCRNLLIYLQPEAQESVISAFDFALRPGGLLLLGNSETVGNAIGHFKVISKAERLYRHIGKGRPGKLGQMNLGATSIRPPIRPGQGQTTSRQAALAELCRRSVIESFAPATVLINARQESLYALGPTDRYLRVPAGNPTLDLLTMARPDIRTKLRSALEQARHHKARTVLRGGRIENDGKILSFAISVQPIVSDGEELSLICFIDEHADDQTKIAPPSEKDEPKVARLQQELINTRMELQGAIRNLEISSEEQKAINEEALSINEEHQSTNEELLTSKEELQSLNEELTALNTQLQETLERQRTTSNDLQNVLYSTDVATLFLDTNLKIRFFTPATRSLFNIIPSDVGRPLADLNSLAADNALTADAHVVLKTLTAVEREIKAQDGTWFIRRILPYRTHNDGVEGVVITFTDISERKQTARALEAATRQAELANIAKTRFLAAANHDLRQPLQTLALLQGLLAKKVDGEHAKKLVARLDETLGAMSGMLNTLLDINQIETGSVQAEKTLFPIGDLLKRLRGEFDYHAEAQGLSLRVVPCSLLINSDPRLLEQMLRNLIANALKYTQHGKVLVGCRRHAGTLSIEIWDTGIGIPETELHSIFEEYHQLDNAARERSRGLGLGLSIVKRLGILLGHRITVHSDPGNGSRFTIEIELPLETTPTRQTPERVIDKIIPPLRARAGMILVVEDDPEVRELLELSLKDDGHRTLIASDGTIALNLMAGRAIGPDLILADYNLPNGPNGLQLALRLRETFKQAIPAIILTGDVSPTTQAEITRHHCVQLNKPLKFKELTEAIQRLLPNAPGTPSPPHSENGKTVTIFIVDDDYQLRRALRSVLEDENHIVDDYPDCESFLEAYRPGVEACLLIDAYLPGMSGLSLLRRLAETGQSLPSIMITGNSDVPMAVEAMKAGASDFIEKPVSRADLLACVSRALEQAHDSGKLLAWRQEAADHMSGLTTRQRQIMDLVLAGHPSKNIAADLGISQRTVENHRASIMKRTGSKSLPALARLALAAASTEAAPTKT